MTNGGAREKARAVRDYHAGSVHHPGRFAPGPGYLDWHNQPEPFREYAGAPRLPLPLARGELDVSWDEVHQPGAVVSRPLERASLGAFFELALGITAWKEYRGSRWALRANPSSGNLHPTEGYAVLAPAGDLPGGVHHYLSREHLLERRFTPSPRAGERIAEILGGEAFLLGLSSIYWREAWKYGARAFRYCQHDVGHAIAAVRYAAGILGWGARLLSAPGDEDVAALLGLDRGDDSGIAAADREHPDALVLVGPPRDLDAGTSRVEAALDALVSAAGDGTWHGSPNPLSARHVAWPMIESVAAATRKPRSGVPAIEAPAPGQEATEADRLAGGIRAALPTAAETAPFAAEILRRRRSAVAMDGRTGLAAERLYRVLARLQPRPAVPPWDAWPWPARVHPLVFAHRIEGLASGVYVLARDAKAESGLRAELRSSFAWSRPTSCPESLPFYRLDPMDARGTARLVSCDQAIASDSAFAVAMLAQLGAAVAEAPWSYRALHWEAGIVGQVLYLEAEAAGLRGTGIGCFFDELVHELVGVASDRFRDVYHFTVGGPLDDERLTTLPAYGDEVTRR